MQRERKTLSVMVRNRKSAKKFQADIKVVDRLGINEIAEQWAESASLKPVMAKTVIGSLEELKFRGKALKRVENQAAAVCDFRGSWLLAFV